MLARTRTSLAMLARRHASLAGLCPSSRIMRPSRVVAEEVSPRRHRSSFACGLPVLSTSTEQLVVRDHRSRRDDWVLHRCVFIYKFRIVIDASSLFYLRCLYAENAQILDSFHCSCIYTRNTRAHASRSFSLVKLLFLAL